MISLCPSPSRLWLPTTHHSYSHSLVPLPAHHRLLLLTTLAALTLAALALAALTLAQAKLERPCLRSLALLEKLLDDTEHNGTCGLPAHSALSLATATDGRQFHLTVSNNIATNSNVNESLRRRPGSTATAGGEGVAKATLTGEAALGGEGAASRNDDVARATADSSVGGGEGSVQGRATPPKVTPPKLMELTLDPTATVWDVRCAVAHMTRVVPDRVRLVRQPGR